jgi:hypothetical protein
MLLCWGLALWGSPEGRVLQLNSDGTASIHGKVEENYRGCARDGVCYFKLGSGESDIHVVYSPGETGASPPNGALVPQLMKVQPGAVIAAHGFHRQSGRLHTIDVYSKKEYFVHVLADGR